MHKQGTVSSVQTQEAWDCCREAFGILAPGDSDGDDSPRSMDQTAMALALLGPNHRGNVTFETINDDDNVEDATSVNDASRDNSADVQVGLYNLPRLGCTC